MLNNEAQRYSNIKAVDEAIRKTLEEAFKKDYAVESFPPDIKKYNFIHPKGCLLVRYDGSTFSKPGTIGAVCQEETLEFAVFAGLRYLHSFSDSYPVLEKVKDLLTALVIKGKKLYPAKLQYVDTLKGDIYYGYVFSVTLPADEIRNKESNVIPFLKE